VAAVSLDDEVDVLLLALVVPEVALADVTALLLSLLSAFADDPLLCWAAAWNSAPRNC
jgi:hypothetical protein